MSQRDNVLGHPLFRMSYILYGSCPIALIGLRLQPMCLKIFLRILDKKARRKSDKNLEAQAWLLHSLVPQNSWNNRAQVPETMSVNHAMPRWEVKQLQAHSKNDPSDTDSR